MKMEESLIQKLIDFVETASPIIWQAAYRQAHVEAISGLLIVVGLVAICAYMYRWYRHFSEQSHLLENSNRWSSKGDIDTGRGFLIFGIAVLGLISLYVLGGAIGRIINPDYYAIKVLAGMVGL